MIDILKIGLKISKLDFKLNLDLLIFFCLSTTEINFLIKTKLMNDY